MRTSVVFHARPIAAFYDLLTGQSFWRRAIDTMVGEAVAEARHRLEKPLARVVDLGCGPGESAFSIAEALPEAEVVGVDIAPAMIARAEHRQRQHQRSRRRTASTAPAPLANLRFEVADAAALPFADATIDLAIGHSFLYLVPDRAGVLADVARVLAPAGSLHLMEPSESGSLRSTLRRSRPAIAQAMRRAPISAVRFAASMVFWRAFSRTAGRMSPTRIQRLLAAAGFARITVEETLGGLGLHGVGVMPAPSALDADVTATRRRHQHAVD